MKLFWDLKTFSGTQKYFVRFANCIDLPTSIACVWNHLNIIGIVQIGFFFFLIMVQFFIDCRLTDLYKYLSLGKTLLFFTWKENPLLAKDWMARCQVLNCWRTCRKTAPGTVGRCRVRPCAKTVMWHCSPGHIRERLIN